MTATSTNTPGSSEQEAAQGGYRVLNAILRNWSRNRADLLALEAAEHPAIIDAHGRTWIWIWIWIWIWKDGDLYVHDGLIAISRKWIEKAGLPSPGLAERNPNYVGMCATCRAP